MTDTFRLLEKNKIYNFYKNKINKYEELLTNCKKDIDYIKERIKETQMMIIEQKNDEFSDNDKTYIKILLENIKDFTEEFKFLIEERNYIKKKYDKVIFIYDNLYDELKKIGLEK
tara:strand:- start:2174 stop:2518 length:345 start_codon:yes stop_codon:yes gene_type:complete